MFEVINESTKEVIGAAELDLATYVENEYSTKML